MFSTPVCLSIDLVTVVELQHIGNVVKSSGLKISLRHPNSDFRIFWGETQTYQSLISVLLFASWFCHGIENNFISIGDLVKGFFGKSMIESTKIIQIYSLESIIHIGFGASIPQLLKLKMLDFKVLLISLSYTCCCLKYRGIIGNSDRQIVYLGIFGTTVFKK